MLNKSNNILFYLYDNIFKYLLKGRGQYFGYALESLLRGILGPIYQVVLSAQKAAVEYPIMAHVCQKKNKIRLQNLTIVTPLNHFRTLIKVPRSEGFREHRICSGFAGNKYGILHMCTSHGLFTAVAGEARKYSTSSLGVESNGSAPTIEEKNEIGKEWFVNDNKLFERAVTVVALKRAWFQLKSKPGMSTKGSSEETFSGISEAWFISTSRKLLEGSFKYPNRRRVLLDKPGGGTRPLTIANPRVKIIERALLNALEPQYEGLSDWEEITRAEYDLAKKKDPENYKKKKGDLNKPKYLKKITITPQVFHPHNYGSRTKKSAHQALHHIKHWRSNTVFLIDYDISKAFDNVNRKRLKNLLNKRISDPRFWLEISKMLNAGTELELRLIFENKGVAQGSILSPFLFNVYMHELDQKVVELQKLTKHTHKSHESATYGNVVAENEYRKISRDFATGNLKRSLKKYGSKEALLLARKTVYKEHHKKYGRRKGIDTEVRHIQYVRYVDDFLIGVVGSRQYAVAIRKDINQFIKGNLHLDVRKDDLVHRSEKSVEFLSHLVKLTEFKSKTSARPKAIRAAMKNKNKSVGRFIESDKRLARSKSHQFAANVLDQFNVLSTILKRSISKKKNFDYFASIIAYKGMENEFLKSLSLESKEQLRELLDSIDLSSLSNAVKTNPALSRWSNYSKEEADRLSEFSAQILYDKIGSLAHSNWREDLSSGEAKKIRKIQDQYLMEAQKVIDSSLNDAVNKKRELTIKKFNIPRGGLNASKDDQELLDTSKELTIAAANKLSTRRISVSAPIGNVFAKLRLKGYVHPIKDKATGNLSLCRHTDAEIVSHYSLLIRGLLNWYSGSDNFVKLKGLAQLLRKSCVLTLSNKHKKSANWVYTVYGSEIRVNNGKKITALTTRTEILNHKNEFNLAIESDHFTLDNLIGSFNKLNHGIEFFKGCSVQGCDETENIQVHHIRRLHRKVEKDGKISVLDIKGNRVTGVAAVLTTLNRKQLPLCTKHHLEFEKGVFSNLDFKKLRGVLGNIPKPNEGDLLPIFEGRDYTVSKK